MDSDNPSGADNQQETISSESILDPHWVVGFVDGEGCFSVSVHRNQRFAPSTNGWQLHPVFHVYQHGSHRDVLELLVGFFGCGRIRSKGPLSAVMTYAVDGLEPLERRVIPFFESHQLRVKQRDFELFAAIVRGMRSKEHCTRAGFERLVRGRLRHERLGQTTGADDRRGTGGILRDCTPGTVGSRAPRGEDTVRSLWRHKESGRNDLTPIPVN